MRPASRVAMTLALALSAGSMLAHNLYELKGKLSSMIVLVMAVKFLEMFFQDKAASELLMQAAAVTIVSAVLIAFGYFGTKD